MKSAVIEPGVVPKTSRPVVDAPRPREDRAGQRPVRWGALYTVLPASVALGWTGSRLVAAVGHAALIEYGVALAILGLLAAWVRAHRRALSSPGAQARFERPFAVLHVPFMGKSARAGQGALGASSNAERQIGAGRPAATAFH
jgi:hypothetical protein